MIIGNKREQVIENIRQATEKGTFNIKVEVDDPVLTDEQRKFLLDNHIKKRETMWFQMNTKIARQIADKGAKAINRTTQISGLENVYGITGSAIVTSNHFNPLDNTVVRMFARRMGKKKLCVVSQDTNLSMTGWVGFLLNYADTIPISTDHNYLTGQFEPMLKELLNKNNYVLIYPEQEMWFNYRKPRPLNRGAYYYAAKFNVPVISCFVEIRDLEELDTPEFYKVQYVLHVLRPIFPDPEKNIRENSIAMCGQDYQQKKAAYEAVYGKLLDYCFEPNDIAGWIAPDTISVGNRQLTMCP